MIKLTKITKEYKINKNTLKALDNVCLEFDDKGFYLIYGKSGSGKTTLLNIIARFESPTKGDLISPYKSEEIGYVTQTIYPLEDFTLFQNLAILGYADEAINDVLDLVQLKEKKNNKVRLLSGGERQRLSIAMIILKDCKVFLLDEPTGNLDDENSIIIFNLLKL
ncbi:MAG: ATP-binding cassette domain-containing protein [Anaeroplasmataceae bacterium]|nr:ATP-binding cassette domain-containing protein [Anaeroplasmataceae bacterium]